MPAGRKSVYAIAMALCGAQESMYEQREQLSMSTLRRTIQDGHDGSSGGEGDDDGPQETKLQAIDTALKEFLRLENALVSDMPIGNPWSSEATRFIFPQMPFNSPDLSSDRQTTFTAETGSKLVSTTR